MKNHISRRKCNNERPGPRFPPDEGLLEASDPGDEVYFQLLVLDVAELDEAAEVYGEMLEGLVKDYRSTDNDDLEINGLTVFYEEGL